MKIALGFYGKDYKTSLKSIKEDLNKITVYFCSWLGRFSIINMAILPKLIFEFSTIANKIHIKLLVEFGKLISFGRRARKS
jgi:hypothetical protein